MAFEKHYDAQPRVTTPPCIHLRSKAMCVAGELRDVEHPDEAGSQHFWCNMTQHVLGPDEAHVLRHTCVPGRDCYRQTH
jgi:hypothetical protein